MSFLANYLPAPAELTPAQLSTVRDSLTGWIKTILPDLDTRPGSVFDASTLSGVVMLVAAVEEGLTRMQQDLDVAGVANGVVFDCDFVERHLLALGARKQEVIDTSGYVLLTFSKDADVDVPGGLQLLFNDVDVMRIRGFPDGIIKIRRAGTPKTEPQIYPLFALSSTTFGAVLPVTGYATTTIQAGTEAATSVVIDNLVSATAVSSFTAGRVLNSVPAVARRSTETAFSAGLMSRGSTRRMLMQTFPDLTGVVVTAPGDPVMLRSALTPLGLSSANCMDLHVGSAYRTTLTQCVRLEYIADQEGASVDAFIGAWAPMETPMVLLKVRALTEPDVACEPVLYSRSTSPVSPLLTCSFSSTERLHMVIPMPKSSAGASLLSHTLAADDKRYAWFEITYLAEPAAGAVRSWLREEGVPWASVLVRTMIPVVITELVVRYQTDPGVLLNEAQATADISAYFDTLFDGRGFSVEDLSDLVYSAGARSVTGFRLRAALHTGIADYVSAADAALPEEDMAGLEAAAQAVPKLPIDDLRSLVNLVWVDPRVGEDDQTLSAAGGNTAFILHPDMKVVYSHES